MKKEAGGAFPYPSKSFQYAQNALRKRWDRLHLGDKEPYPSAQCLAKLCKENNLAPKSIPGFNGDLGPVPGKGLEAWRCYPQGEFQEAAERGLSLGAIGYAVANKAAAIHATYL